MMASPEPEPWKGKIIRYKKLPSADGEEIRNESSSSEEDLKTRIKKLEENGTGTDRERGNYGSGTDGERENAGSAERLALDAASVAVDTWERGTVPKSPDQWSSARSSLVWDDDEPEKSSEPDRRVVTENGYHLADERLPAPPVHRKTYNKPIELLEGSSSSSSSLTPPYHTPARVEPNSKWTAGPVKVGLPEERLSAKCTERVANGEYLQEHVDHFWPEGLSNHGERVSIEMPDEVVISSHPKELIGTEMPDEVGIAERLSKDRAKPGRPGERDGSSHEVPGARVINDEPKEIILEEPTSAGSPGVRFTSTPTGSGDTEPISISNVIADFQEVINEIPIRETPLSSGSSQALSPLRWDTHLPTAARTGDPLGYDIYARSIAEIVTDEMTEMPLTVGIYGGWGMGKTYLLGKMKEMVDEIIGKKRREHERYVEGEVDGLEQNKSRVQKTRFPTALFSVLLALFLLSLAATVACAFHFDRVWVVFLVGTVTAFVLLVATLLYGFRRQIQGFCTERVPLLQKSNPMHWMVGIYLEWVKPPNMDEKPQHNNLQYEVIWVHFNAWEFSGCKVLWAGIVTTLCDAIEGKVGSRPTRFFRVIQGQLNGGKKKALFRRAWFKLLLSAVGVVILVVIVLILVFSGGAAELDKFMQGPQIKAIIGSITGFLGLGIVVHLRKGVDMVKNMAKSQKEKLDAQMKKPDFAEQLGFMSEVKSEVQTVTSLLRFLERVMGIQYRVIIVVDDLDCCPGDRVVGVLEAMNILLSDEESNIISIVAMDPKIIVNCLESRLTDTITNNSSGYEYLKRIVQFPVCLPEPSVADRRKLLYTVVDGKSGILIRKFVSVKTGRISFKAGTKARQMFQKDAMGQTSTKGRPSLWTALPDAPFGLENQDGSHQGVRKQDGGNKDVPNQDGDTQEGPTAPLLSTTQQLDEVDAAERMFKAALKTQVSTHELLNNFRQDVVSESYKDYLGDVIQALDDDDGDADNDIMPYIHGNALHITSLYHILRMTVKVLRHRQLLQCITPRQVASWVILVEQWPYRISWVLQYVEDCQQKDRIRRRCHQAAGQDGQSSRLCEEGKNEISNDTALDYVFDKVKPEMTQVDPDGFRRLNNLDGDPEMFELLLTESKFTVKDLMNLLPCTINLDYSIQRRIATARELFVQ
ncbi:kinase D-interacting substrate of 220 kDa B-like [Branchiostoma floridae x Branchiostoma japonicum]